MEIGTAIKTVRKKKKLSQKQVGEMAGISVNALSLIETNTTFPQKSTIKALADSLDVPVSYLLFFSINDEDVPQDKKEIFNTLHDAIKAVLLSGNHKD